MRAPPKSLQERAAQPLQPGFVGKRYAFCSDGKYHLILSILDNGVVDTQCSTDVALVKDVGGELCKECWEIQFGKYK